MNDKPKKSHRVRCRSGELALVIGELPGREANIGRFVRVLRPARQWSRNNRLWRAQPVQPTPWAVIVSHQEGSLQRQGEHQRPQKLADVGLRKHAKLIVSDEIAPRMDSQLSEIVAHPVVGIEDRFLLAIRDTVLLGELAPKQPPIEPLN